MLDKFVIVLYILINNYPPRTNGWTTKNERLESFSIKINTDRNRDRTMRKRMKYEWAIQLSYPCSRLRNEQFQLNRNTPVLIEVLWTLNYSWNAKLGISKNAHKKWAIFKVNELNFNSIESFFYILKLNIWFTPKPGQL